MGDIHRAQPSNSLFGLYFWREEMRATKFIEDYGIDTATAVNKNASFKDFYYSPITREYSRKPLDGNYVCLFELELALSQRTEPLESFKQRRLVIIALVVFWLVATIIWRMM